MLTLVLCRFSLPFGKYFLKLNQNFASSRLDTEWLPSPYKWARAMSARECRCRLEAGNTLTKSASSS